MRVTRQVSSYAERDRPESGVMVTESKLLGWRLGDISDEVDEEQPKPSSAVREAL